MVSTQQFGLRSHAVPNGTVTILFSDIEGFTQTTEWLGYRRMQQVLRVRLAVPRGRAIIKAP